MTNLRAAYLLCAILATPVVSVAQVSGGYQEAVFSVTDAAQYADFFESVAGWQRLYSGDVDRAILRAWDLPKGATAVQVVLGNPGTRRGYVRLLEFSGVQQQQIRSSAQSWDTGGWFDVNTHVPSMATAFASLQTRNWQAATDPVEFGFGPYVVKEWLARGPDGVVMALIERIEPPLEGWPMLKKMSRLFNATQIVTDIDAARDFYINKLGFETYLEHSGASDKTGPNVLGLPHNLSTEITRHVSILHPDGLNEGSVELLQFDGATGADFSDLAVPPNLGILMLRFPVEDAVDFAEKARSKGIEIAMEPLQVELPPYGRKMLVAIRGPGGVWIEFYSD